MNDDARDNETTEPGLQAAGSADATQETDQASDVQAGDYVTSADFQAYTESVSPVIEGMGAASAVIVIAVFFCAGVLCVQTLLRSLEWL